jgi:hypothetical protein
MTFRERFHAALNFRAESPLPAMEWICWWDKTITRWKGEGLPPDLSREDTLRWFGLDVHEWLWVQPRYQIPRIHDRARSLGFIDNADEYERIVAPVMAEPRVDPAALRRMAASQATGNAVVWMQLDGYFWFPREILGVEAHLFSFYDQPELLHRINQDLCRYHLAILRQVLEVFTPDVFTFAEDLSYNHGPMLSEEQFKEFVAPYYRQVIPLLKEHGVLPMIDTDGDVTAVIPWLQAAGVEGCLPLERMAGVDVAAIRRCHPKWRMIGGLDKTILHLGEAAIRAELDRLWPVVRTGGFIPTTDHQTPPEVSLADYQRYVRILKEYCCRM